MVPTTMRTTNADALIYIHSTYSTIFFHFFFGDAPDFFYSVILHILHLNHFNAFFFFFLLHVYTIKY
jgi:hypothetical protein